MLRRQLLKLIEWTDTRTDLIAFKFPMDSRAEIMNGSTLVVREGQIAVFTKDGQIADIFAPGRYRLETKNMPVLTTLMNWHHGFKNPFKCDVWFVNTTLFTGQKWGTANPFTMRDPEFGVIRIRGFGTYNFRVLDAKLLMLNLVGSRPEFTITNIKDKLRSIITSNISAIIAESKYGAIDLSTRLREFSGLARDCLQEHFRNVGFELALLVVENISFPEEVERSIDSRASVGLLSDKMGSFVAMQQAKAMRDAASNTAGVGGAFMGMGMMRGMGGFGGGRGMGMDNARDTNESGGGVSATPVTRETAEPKKKAAAETKPCSKCSVAIPAASRFCGECGTKQEAQKHCPQCGIKLKKGARFCSDCGEKIGE